MGLQDLADVHAARHAQRVQQDLDRGAVLEERHVLLGQDLGDDALVAVPAGHLVADRDDPLGGDVNLDHLQHARGQLVAALQAVQLAVLLVAEGLDPRAVHADDACVGLALSGLRRSSDFEPEALALLGQNLRVFLAAERLAAGRVEHRPADGFLQRLDELPVFVGDLDVLGRLGVLQLFLEGLAFVFVEAHPAAEPLRC